MRQYNTHLLYLYIYLNAFFSMEKFPLEYSVVLTFTTLWANLADYKLMVIFLILPKEKTLVFHTGDNVHEIKSPMSGEKKKKKKYFKLLSTDFWVDCLHSSYSIQTDCLHSSHSIQTLFTLEP